MTEVIDKTAPEAPGTSAMPLPASATHSLDFKPQWRNFHRRDEFGILLATIVIVLVAVLISPGTFLQPANLASIGQQISITLIIAAGMTFIIVAGEIDLSVGSQYGFAGVMLAWMVHDVGIPIGGAIPLVLLIGAAVGAINGIVTVFFEIPSFIVTLASLSVLRGAALLISGGVPIQGSVNPDFRAITAASTHWAWALVVVVVGAVIFAYTKFGSDVYSVGGNRKAASDSGINERLIRLMCFTATGVLCAVGGILLVGWLGNANPLSGTGLELTVIAAVVVGGAALSGGKGTIFGTVLGAVIAGVLANALVLAGVDGNWQMVATGLLIVGAILVNRFVAKRAARVKHA